MSSINEGQSGQNTTQSTTRPHEISYKRRWTHHNTKYEIFSNTIPQQKRGLSQVLRKKGNSEYQDSLYVACGR